jgi:hypothetical protein
MRSHLHDQVWPVCADTSNANTSLCGAKGSSHAYSSQPRSISFASYRGVTYIQISSDRGSFLSSRTVRMRATHCKGNATLLLLAMKSSASAAGTHHAEEGRKGRREVLSLRRHDVLSMVEEVCVGTRIPSWLTMADGDGALRWRWSKLTRRMGQHNHLLHLHSRQTPRYAASTATDSCCCCCPRPRLQHLLGRPFIPSPHTPSFISTSRPPPRT